MCVEFCFVFKVDKFFLRDFRKPVYHNRILSNQLRTVVKALMFPCQSTVRYNGCVPSQAFYILIIF